MSVSITKLKPKQHTAILALMAHRTVEEAARATKIAPRTLYRWQDEPEFAAAYLKARRTAFGQAIARLQQASGAAATTLLKILLDPSTPAATKVRAVDRILDHGAKGIEREDLEARIAALELALNLGKPR